MKHSLASKLRSDSTRFERFPRALRAGFTLIELLAVIVIISILMVFLIPKIPAAMDRAKVVACKANMKEMYNGFLAYYSKYNGVPKESGVRFFASLITRGVWENTESSARKLTCPGVLDTALDVSDIPLEEWYSDPEMITGGYSSYAGRDMKRNGMRKFPGSGKEPLVADDNDPEMNHDTTTVVLYASGDIGTYELFDLRDEGLLGEEEILYVGPESQVERLQKLSLD